MTPPWLRRQLAGPHGWLARPMAHLLDRLNRAEVDHALAHLDPRRGDTVLELGFGGGYGVRRLLDAGATVLASEPAVAMRARAHCRFAWPLAEGRLTVWPHAAEDLPDHPVDRALSLNTVYFWRDVDEGFRRLRRMVRHRLVLGIASPAHLRQEGFHLAGYRTEPLEWYAERLERVGFDARLVPLADTAADLIVASPSVAQP